MKGTDGLISMKLIQTGPNNTCTIGEWKMSCQSQKQEIK